MMNKKKQVKVVMASPYLEGMEILIQDGLYENQSEILKDALRRLFSHYQIHSINEVFANETEALE
jgi:Arc/MetJ-type ribon-helix-helix transcriptional regulator